MRVAGALWLLVVASGLATAETPSVQRWDLRAGAQGKVEVSLTYDAARLAKLMREHANPDAAVAAELLAWEGISAWTEVAVTLEPGKPASIKAVGWFADLSAVVAPRGHGWRLKAEQGALRVEQVAQGRDASRLLDAFLFDLGESTYTTIRAGLPLILTSRAPETAVTQVVTPPSAPRDAVRITVSDGKAEVVYDLARLQAEAKVLIEAITDLRQKIKTKAVTREAAPGEAFGRLTKTLGAFVCDAPDPERVKAFATELAAAQASWATSPWRLRLKIARALAAKASAPEAPPEPRHDPTAFEPNDTRAEAKPVQPGTYAGLLLKGEDWYRIDTPAGHTLEVSTRFFPAFGDLDLELFAERGKAVRVSAGRGRIERISVDPQGKTLWLRVYGHDRRWNRNKGDPRYMLSVAHVPYAKRDALEPNDPPHPPREVTVGGHKNLIGDGLDVYRVKPMPKGVSKLRRLKVVLRFDETDDLDLELCDARGRLLVASRGTGETESASSLEPPGGLFLRVLGTGRYTLEISAVPGPDVDAFEPNDTRAQAKPLRAGYHSDLVLNTEDWYRLTLKPGRQLSVEATPDPETGVDLDLELCDARGKVLRRAARLKAGPETISLSGHTGPIYLRVHSAGFVGYTLRVRDERLKAADRFEPNETRAAAKPIGLGKHTGLKCTGEDWYRLPTLPPNKELVVTIAFDLAAHGDLDLELFLGGRRVAASRGLGRTARIAWSGEAKGALTLRVFPAQAPYRLTLEQR